MKMMFVLPVIFLIVTSNSLAADPVHAKASTKVVSTSSKRARVSPDDRAVGGRMGSTPRLQQAAAHLRTFFDSRDPKALTVLLDAWSPEERTFIKREFMAFKGDPAFRVQGTKMFISLEQDEVTLQVEDPFNGVLRVNGHLIRVQPESRYEDLKEKLSLKVDVSERRSLFLPWLLPAANAGLGTFALQQAEKLMTLVRPVTATTGGLVKKEAAVTGDAVGDEFMRAAKEARTPPTLLQKAGAAVKGKAIWVAGFVGAGAAGPALWNCFGLNMNWDDVMQSCPAKQVGKLLCDKKKKPDGCVTTTGEASAQLVGTDKSVTPYVETDEDNKCVLIDKGFAKDVNVRFIKDSVIAKAKKERGPDVPLKSLPPLFTHETHIEYSVGKDEKNPQLLNKSMSDTVIAGDGKTIMEQSFWTYKGDDWTITIFDKPPTKLKEQDLSDLRTIYMHPRKLECKKAKLSDECQVRLNQTLESMGPAKSCAVKDPEKAVSDVNRQTKANEAVH
jgi:hypothetical protein